MKLYVCELVPQIVDEIEIKNINDIDNLFDDVEGDNNGCYEQDLRLRYVSTDDMWKVDYDYAVELLEEEENE